MNFLRTGLAAFAWVVCASTAHALPTQVVSGGKLTGALGVVVSGNLYNVEFLAGTCEDLFHGCDDASDFDFQTQTGALAAATALLDQVFLDTSAGFFDTNPGLTRGCNVSVFCQVMVPYTTANDYANTMSAQNSVQESLDVASFGTLMHKSAQLNDSIWAVFTPAPSTVPTPGTLALLSLGLGSAVMVRRRRAEGKCT